MVFRHCIEPHLLFSSEPHEIHHFSNMVLCMPLLHIHVSLSKNQQGDVWFNPHYCLGDYVLTQGFSQFIHLENDKAAKYLQGNLIILLLTLLKPFI